MDKLNRRGLLKLTLAGTGMLLLPGSSQALITLPPEPSETPGLGWVELWGSRLGGDPNLLLGAGQWECLHVGSSELQVAAWTLPSATIQLETRPVTVSERGWFSELRLGNHRGHLLTLPAYTQALPGDQPRPDALLCNRLDFVPGGRFQAAFTLNVPWPFCDAFLELLSLEPVPGQSRPRIDPTAIQEALEGFRTHTFLEAAALKALPAPTPTPPMLEI